MICVSRELVVSVVDQVTRQVLVDDAEIAELLGDPLAIRVL